MTLSADEFIRRFLLHVLPKGFHRIRHYGLLASAGCKANIARARELIAAPMPEPDPPTAHGTADPDAATDHHPPCPCCGGRMIIVEVFGRYAAPRGPPSAAASGICTNANLWPLVATFLRRNFPVPAPRSCHSAIGKRRHDILDRYPIRPSATLARPSPQIISCSQLSPTCAKPSPNNAAARPIPHRRLTPRRCPARSFFGGFRTPALGPCLG